jgi:hypothetical protein
VGLLRRLLSLIVLDLHATLFRFKAGSPTIGIAILGESVEADDRKEL